jgi:hypothetical protein
MGNITGSTIMLVGGAITILKNIGQWEGLSHILWKIKMLETTNPNGFIGFINQHGSIFPTS